MADVQCGKFELVHRDPQSGNLRFRAKLTPAPSAHWTAVFYEFQASERELGNLAVARIFKDDVIEFDVPEAGSKAAAAVIRRCVEMANPEATKREAARQRLSEAQQRQVDDEWKRVRDKYRDGL
jgi:hypothetical protein